MKILTPAHVSLTLVASLLLLPSWASAQQLADAVSPAAFPLSSQAGEPQNVPAPARQAEASVERAVKRFRVGVEAGVSLDPELIDFGAHATFGPVFSPNVVFRPGVEFGIGEVTTLFAINLDVLYTFPGATRQTQWTPYIGAGPNFTLSHRGFEVNNVDDGNRFDFGDTSFNSGFNFIAGVRSQGHLFLEMKATAWGVSNVRLLAGFNF